MSEGAALVNAARLLRVRSPFRAQGRTQTINEKVGLVKGATRARRSAASMQFAEAVPALGPLTLTA